MERRGASLHKDDKGRTWWAVTKEGTSNEAIDCLVYAYAALCIRKAKSRRVREASAIRLEARASEISDKPTPPSAVTLNASRPGAQPSETGGRALAGVRRISGAAPRRPVPPPIATAQGKAPRRFGVRHGGGDTGY